MCARYTRYGNNSWSYRTFPTQNLEYFFDSYYLKPWAKAWAKLFTLKDRGRAEQGTYYPRGESYGSISCEVRSGEITVRGEDFSLDIEVAPLSNQVWESIVSQLVKKVCFEVELKNLLARNNALQLSSKLQELITSLVPVSRSEIQIKCTCQETASLSTITCGHVATAWTSVAYEFQADPWALFRFRGKGPEELFPAIYRHRVKTLAAISKKESKNENTESRKNAAVMPYLSPSPTPNLPATSFWIINHPLPVLPVDNHAREPLDPFPVSLVFLNKLNFSEALDRFYAQTSTSLGNVVTRFKDIQSQLITTATTVASKSKESLLKKLNTPEIKGKNSKNVSTSRGHPLVQKKSPDKGGVSSKLCYLQVNTTPPLLVTLNSSATLRELEEKLSPRNHKRAEFEKTFYYIDQFQNYNGTSLERMKESRGLRVLTTIYDLEHVTLSQAFPHAGDQVLYRPDPSMNVFLTVKLLDTFRHRISVAKSNAEITSPRATTPVLNSIKTKCDIGPNSSLLYFRVKGRTDTFFEISSSSTLTDLATLISHRFNVRFYGAYKFSNGPSAYDSIVLPQQARKRELKKFFTRIGETVQFSPDISQPDKFLVELVQVRSSQGLDPQGTYVSPKKEPPLLKVEPKKEKVRDLSGKILRRISNAHQIQFRGRRYYVDPQYRGREVYLQFEGKSKTPIATNPRGQPISISTRTFDSSPLKTPIRIKKKTNSSHKNQNSSQTGDKRAKKATAVVLSEIRNVDKWGRFNFRGVSRYVNPSLAGCKITVAGTRYHITAFDEKQHHLQVFRSRIAALKSGERRPLPQEGG
ncbi:MAG: hypothetical protein RBG13Loki_2450, partial [Promethearchaeota archaeon CR_4]